MNNNNKRRKVEVDDRANSFSVARKLHHKLREYTNRQKYIIRNGVYSTGYMEQCRQFFFLCRSSLVDKIENLLLWLAENDANDDL